MPATDTQNSTHPITSANVTLTWKTPAPLYASYISQTAAESICAFCTLCTQTIDQTEREKEKKKERTEVVKDERRESNYLPLIGAYNKREISLSLQPPS